MPRPGKAINSETGEVLVLTPGHGRNLGRYTFSNERTGLIAFGNYRSRWFPADHLMALEIISLRTQLGSASPDLARSEYDLAPLVGLICGRSDAAYVAEIRPKLARKDPPKIIVIRRSARVSNDKLGRLPWFGRKQTNAANVCFGSKADIEKSCACCPPAGSVRIIASDRDPLLSTRKQRICGVRDFGKNPLSCPLSGRTQRREYRLSV